MSLSALAEGRVIEQPPKKSAVEVVFGPNNRKKRKEERKQKALQEKAGDQQKAPVAKPAVTRALQPGDTCRIKGQTSVGVLERIDGKKATVTFGMMKTLVELDRLMAAKPTAVEATGPVSSLSRATQNEVREKHLSFTQQLDVRGMRGDEALQAVTYYIDDAVLVGSSMVRILHGTGSGILRTLIREYLQTLPFVASARDEHVQFGGSGITVVTFKGSTSHP